MRWLVLLSSLSMPLVAWLSNRGTFGPDNATLSARYPTLLVAAGYAFAIWGPIFLLDLGYAGWQARTRADETRTRVPASLAFVLTSTWMIVFSLEWFWVSLAVIVASLTALLIAAVRLSSAGSALSRGATWLAWLPLSLHAGWVSLAAFLNLAQVLVASRAVDTHAMLGWSLSLFVGCALLLMWANARMRGNVAYAAAALWGFVGVYVAQSRSALPGSDTSARIALMLGLLLLMQTAWLLVRRRQSERQTASS